jgi:hypothetical protein
MWLIACRSNDVEWLWQPEVAKKIAFPPVWSKKKLPRHPVMRFIAKDAKTILKRLQEDQGGEVAKALRDLDQFWNIDKHRVSHNGVAKLDLSEVRFLPGSVRSDDLTPLPVGEALPVQNPVKDGADLVWIRFRSGLGPPHTQVKVQGNPRALVAFGGGPVALSTYQISMLLVHADGALLTLSELAETASLSAASQERDGSATA